MKGLYIFSGEFGEIVLKPLCTKAYKLPKCVFLLGRFPKKLGSGNATKQLVFDLKKTIKTLIPRKIAFLLGSSPYFRLYWGACKPWYIRA